METLLKAQESCQEKEPIKYVKFVIPAFHPGENRGGIQKLPDNAEFRVVLRVHGMTKNACSMRLCKPL